MSSGRDFIALCANKKVRPEPDFNKTFTGLTEVEKNVTN